MKKIYVGCSLMHATQEFRDSIEELKRELRKGYEIIDFLGLGNGTPQEIFTHDRESVLKSDLMIAECSYPSTGLGIEVGIAISNDKQVIAVAKTDAIVSAMIIGIDYPRFSFDRYEDSSELLKIIEKRIAQI